MNVSFVGIVVKWPWPMMIRPRIMKVDRRVPRAQRSFMLGRWMPTRLNYPKVHFVVFLSLSFVKRDTVIFLSVDVAFKVGGATPIKYLVLQVHYSNIDKFLAGETDRSGLILSTSAVP
jgi:hypothetical protein